MNILQSEIVVIIYYLNKVSGEPGEVLPQVGVQLLSSELPGSLLGGGGGVSLVKAQRGTHREVTLVRRARVPHQLVVRLTQAVLLTQLL